MEYLPVTMEKLDSAQKELSEVVNSTQLTLDQKQKIVELANTINIEDSNFILQYGTSAQTQISTFADTILNEVKNKDAGPIGDMMSDLMNKVKELDVDSLGGNKNIFQKLFGGATGAFQKFMSRYQKLGNEIEKITKELDGAKNNLMKDIQTLDNLYQKNLDYLNTLNYYIAAGIIKLKDLQENIVPKLQEQANLTNNPGDIQKLNDTLQLVNRFEKKIHDLKLSRTIAIQTAPQIRLIQNNNQTLVEKIQSSVINTIPLWKNQIVIAISLYRQKKAVDLQKSVSDTTNELLSKNSEMLKENSISVAKENERGIVDIETLKKVNTNLLATIEETLKIQEDGRIKRIQAEEELKRIELELKEKLMSTRGRM